MNRNTFWSVAVMTTVLQFSAISGFAGGEGVGGGDLYAFEFKGVARKLLQRMKEVGESQLDFDIAAFENAIDKTTVNSVKVACLDLGVKPCRAERVRDAVNFPERRLIHVQKSSWESIRAENESKEQLVLHEYFGILGLEKDVNDKSTVLLNRLDPGFQAWKRLEGKLLVGISNTDTDHSDSRPDLLCKVKIRVNEETRSIDLVTVPTQKCTVAAIYTHTCDSRWLTCDAARQQPDIKETATLKTIDEKLYYERVITMNDGRSLIKWAVWALKQEIL